MRGNHRAGRLARPKLGLPLVLLLALLLPVPACDSGPEPLRVFAAASLADVLTEVGEAWGEAIEFNFAGSNELARQVLAGAPADLFLSADRRQVDRLDERFDLSRAEPFLANRLVLIVPRDSELEGSTAEILAAAERVAVADPEAVPAGVYARQWLEAQRLWPDVRERIVPTLDVRAALAAVASASVDAGIVYATDAATTDRVEVRIEASSATAPQVLYWLLPLDDDAATSSFRDFLLGEGATPILRRHGFERPDRSGADR